MDAEKVAKLLAVTRLLIGTALTAAPRRAASGWIGPHSRNGGAKLMTRATGARDVGLAAGLLASLPQREERRRWLQAAAFADAADFLATVAAARSLPRRSLAIGTSMAGASTLAHLWLRGRLG